MFLRPASPMMRGIALGSSLTAIGVPATFDFVHRWPLAITSLPSDPFRMIAAAGSVVQSSPLLLGATIFYAIVAIFYLVRLVTGPAGLQTPE